MNHVIQFFGSGNAFFAGIGCILVAVALQTARRGRWSVRAATLIAIVGVLLVAVSGTPLPYWFYAVAAAVALLWMVVERSERAAFAGRRRWLRAAVVAVCCTAAALEVPYHLVPVLDRMEDRPTLHIFADSVTAGMEEAGVETWPRLLARARSIEVRDHSQMGAKVKTMLRKARETPVDKGLVLVEIGGNDLLGTTVAQDFERDLDELLRLLSGPDRVVAMFELPLPPFRNDFGLAQRRLASKHDVRLIPKRVFINVLTAEAATVDSIHLSRSGHERMAAAVWALIGPAYGN